MGIPSSIRDHHTGIGRIRDAESINEGLRSALEMDRGRMKRHKRKPACWNQHNTLYLQGLEAGGDRLHKVFTKLPQHAAQPGVPLHSQVMGERQKLFFSEGGPDNLNGLQRENQCQRALASSAQVDHGAVRVCGQQSPADA